MNVKRRNFVSLCSYWMYDAGIKFLLWRAGDRNLDESWIRKATACRRLHLTLGILSITPYDRYQWY